MATKITKIQVRRDSSLNWLSVNPILSVGEFALETDSQIPGGRFKIGDGQSDWQNLAYFGAGEKGDFNEITLNGPMLNSPYLPGGIPQMGLIDGIPENQRNQYATSTVGTYTRGIATYHHIFPVEGFTDLDGVVVQPSLGRTNARFSELYVKSDSIHIGDNVDDEIVLSHVAGATSMARVVIAGDVDPGGRVASVSLLEGGLGYREGDILSVQYATEYPGSKGIGLRLKVDSVDVVGKVTAISIVDAGAGYESNQIVDIIFRSQLAITRNAPDGTTTTTELATKEALQQVNSQTLNLVGIGEEIAPYLQNAPRGLPDTSGVASQSEFNIWATASLGQLDSQKVQLQNCTNQIDGKAPTIDPQTGLPEYKVLLNNSNGLINPAFVGISTTKVLKGGEILFFNNLQQWEVASGSGDGVGNEEDPIFVASAAFRIEENSDTVSKFLEYTTKVGLGAGPEKIMFIDNWDTIPSL